MKTGLQRAVSAALLVVVALAGTHAHAQGAAGDADVAIMPFDQRQLDDGLSESLMDAFQYGFSRALGRPVLGQQDLVNLLGLEKQKELLGCDAGSCVAEVGGALGVRYVVFGRYAKVGQTYLVTVKFMDATQARLLLTEQESIRIPPDKEAREQALLEGVQRLAQRLGESVVALMNKAGGAAAQPAPAKTPAASTAPPPATATTPAPAPARESAVKQNPPPAAAATPVAAETLEEVRTREEGGLGNLPWGLAAAFAGVSCCLVGGPELLVGVLATLVGAVLSVSGAPEGAGYALLCGAGCCTLGCCASTVGLASGGVAGFLFTRRNGKTVPIKDVEDAPAPVPGAEEAKPDEAPPPAQPAEAGVPDVTGDADAPPASLVPEAAGGTADPRDAAAPADDEDAPPGKKKVRKGKRK